MSTATTTNPDAYVRGIIDANVNMLVPHYLIHSYLYYVLDDPVISDGLYDHICKELYARWEEIEHLNKDLVDHSVLVAGSGFYLEYPERVKGAAHSLHRMFRGRKTASAKRRAPRRK